MLPADAQQWARNPLTDLLCTSGQLREFRVRRSGGNRHAEALEVRRQIGILLLAAHRRREAAEVLRAVRDDLFRERGADDPDVREVANLLARIRLTTGSVGR